MGPEARVESRCCALARQAGGLAIKLSSIAGLPDRFFVLENWMFVAEFKSRTGRLRRRQSTVRRKIESLGHTVYVIRTVAEFRELTGL